MGDRSDAPHALRIVQLTGAAEGADWFAPMCAGLAGCGHQVRAVIDARPGDLGARLAAAGVPVARVDMSLRRPLAAGRPGARAGSEAARIAAAAARVARLLRAAGADVVISHHLNATLIGRLGATAARVPLRMAMIPSPFTLEAPLTRRLDRATVRADHAVIAGSRHIRELYARLGVPAERLEVVYYGADAARFDPAAVDRSRARARLGVPEGAPLIGQVAHFYAPIDGGFAPPAARGRGVKGHEVLLRAAPAVLAARPDARFVLAGAARGAAAVRYRVRVRELSASLGLGGSVEYLGDRRDVPELLAALDVSVQPSLVDNLGGTIESLLMAVPTVASRVGGMPEAVRHEQTGLLVEPDRPAELAAAILRLLDSPGLGAALARRGRELMLARFTLARTLADLDRIVRARHPACRAGSPPAAGAA